MDQTQPLEPSVHAQYAHMVLYEYQKGQNRPFEHPSPSHDDGTPVSIGILGGGAAGLFTAMLLESIQGTGKPKFVYEILEANPERAGGRLWTKSMGKDDVNYFDVGAMRFPNIPFMDRTFRLFKELDITTENQLLIKYIMSQDNNLMNFNEITLTKKQYNDKISGGDPDPFKTMQLQRPVKDFIKQKVGKIKESLKRDFKNEWEQLVKTVDAHSMRSYMALVEPEYSQKIINTLETFDSGTNFYNSAFLELIMMEMDFNWPTDNETGHVDWFTVQGGSSRIVERMESRVRNLHKGSRVTSISPNLAGDLTWESVNVEVNGAPYKTYDHVVNTMPFGCFRNLDTSKCNFNWDLRQAIRSLKYANSVKVGIRFKYRWWETEKGQKGGVSSTDRPTRMVIYPSYGIDSKTARTMIVSYSWGQDADRLGALCQGHNTQAEKELVSLILRDLSDIHGYKDYTHLPDLVEDHFAWNWGSNEYSAGAFALFGPGQFSSLYPQVTAPCGRLHFAGEATSVHHAWLVGALNSAFRVVYQILYAEKMLEDFETLKQKWGLDDEFDERTMRHQLEIGINKPKQTYWDKRGDEAPRD